jgi:hypothetical protein
MQYNWGQSVTLQPRPSDSGPFPPPTDPSRRTHQHREVGENIEHWVWEKNADHWTLGSTRSRAELEAWAETHIEKPTEADIVRICPRCHTQTGQTNPMLCVACDMILPPR